MISYKKLQKIVTVTGVVLFCLSANASTLYIKNDEAVEVNIIIEPGEGTVLPNKESIKTVLKPNEERKITVSKEQFNTEIFSITGKVKMPSIYNKCDLLLIDKNYKITFTPAKSGGTICIAEIIK